MSDIVDDIREAMSMDGPSFVDSETGAQPGIEVPLAPDEWRPGPETWTNPLCNSLASALRFGGYVPGPVVHRCKCGATLANRWELCSACAATELEELREMALTRSRRTLPPWPHARLGPALAKSVDQRLLEGARGWSALGGLGLVLLGDTGAGKTTLAVALVAHRLDHAKTPEQVRIASAIRFVSVPALQLERDQQKLGTEDGPLMRWAKRAALLVLDEVGYEHQARTGLAPVVRDVAQARYDAALPTIVTSGLTEAGLVERYGEATKRRLCERAKVVTAFGGRQ